VTNVLATETKYYANESKSQKKFVEINDFVFNLKLR
jgi:hypothetical protein